MLISKMGQLSIYRSHQFMVYQPNRFNKCKRLILKIGQLSACRSRQFMVNQTNQFNKCRIPPSPTTHKSMHYFQSVPQEYALSNFVNFSLSNEVRYILHYNTLVTFSLHLSYFINYTLKHVHNQKCIFFQDGVSTNFENRTSKHLLKSPVHGLPIEQI